MMNYWSDYPALQSQLNDVIKIIEDALQDSQEFIYEAVQDTLHSGGKMLRPSFVLLGATFGDSLDDNILNMAAIVEMLHIATLIHDDIIDDSKLRRGVESIQSKHGKDSAVFIGDYLFAKCFTLLSKHYSQESMMQLSKAILNICKGELRQFSFRYQYHTSVMQYLKIISGKTAALFAMSLYIGGKESKAEDDVLKSLSKIGYRVGMAFQIIDDCLDYSDKKIIKKNTMNDLKQGYLTLPIIYALQNDNHGELKKLLDKSNFTEDDIEKIYSFVIQNNGLVQAQALAKKYTKKSFATLEKLPNTESKEMLARIIQTLLNRIY
ncbi:MAG: polyprenyl synthetase family protein [Eubacteriales bacterium]